MAIIVHGPGVADPVKLDRLPREGGVEQTQPAAPVPAISDEEQSPSRLAKERLHAAISAAGEREGASARALRAGLLMQDAVYLLNDSMPLAEARQALHARELYQAPVVDGDRRLVGMLGLSDLLRLAWPVGGGVQSVSDAMTVGQACRKPVDALRENAPLEVIVRLMLDKGYAAMPVVDDEGKVIGMVGMRDLLHGLLGTVRLEVWA